MSLGSGTAAVVLPEKDGACADVFAFFPGVQPTVRGCTVVPSDTGPTPFPRIGRERHQAKAVRCPQDSVPESINPPDCSVMQLALGLEDGLQHRAHYGLDGGKARLDPVLLTGRQGVQRRVPSLPAANCGSVRKIGTVRFSPAKFSLLPVPDRYVTLYTRRCPQPTCHSQTHGKCRQRTDAGPRKWHNPPPCPG